MIVLETHKHIINRLMATLENYDSLRPDGHIYEFHLHSYRVAQSMKSLAKSIGFDNNYCDALYWATLPHDIGKISLPVEIWDMDEKPSDEIKDERRSHTWRGVEIIRKEFGDECNTSTFLKLLIDIMENHHETLDGTGYKNKTANELSKEVRMACICDAFDGYSIPRPHFGNRDTSPTAVIKRMQTEKHGQFDSQLLKSFEEITLCQLKPSL